ncbi:MAG TPA: retropepsin-like aspartic protease [Phycisphaerae bacterium]|nr:retropepsin-like aspartic protease [Phycisphaerae bacterium]
MSFSFDPTEGLIIVNVRFWGPAGMSYARLALDTGATGTMFNTAKLVYAGYDPAAAEERVRVTTGSGIEYAPRLSISQIEALGQHRKSLPVLAHTLPPSASVDGLLGLDFFRGHRLEIDFQEGRIVLD